MEMTMAVSSSSLEPSRLEGKRVGVIHEGHEP